MAQFKTLTSRVVVLPSNDIDTDQIIPARYLKVTDKAGLGANLFADWRYANDGTPRPDFVLNQPGARGAAILLAGDNFGCGSSREHAPWALTGFGFRAVISTSFADIFRNNALKNGLLPIVVDRPHAELMAQVAQPPAPVTVDLAAQTLSLPDGSKATFPVDAVLEDLPAQRHRRAGIPAVVRARDRGVRGGGASAWVRARHDPDSTTPPSGTARSARGSRSPPPTRSASRAGWTSWGSPSSRAAGPAPTRKDAEFFERARDIPWQTALIAAFGSTCRVQGSPDDDANIQALLQAHTAVCTVVGKTWTLHVTDVLRTTLDDNLRIIEESLAYLRAQGRRVIYDAEHFFDGYKADPAYALETLRAAVRGGAETVVLCDTNGGSMPWEITEIVRDVKARASASVRHPHAQRR